MAMVKLVGSGEVDDAIEFHLVSPYRKKIGGQSSGDERDS